MEGPLKTLSLRTIILAKMSQNTEDYFDKISALSYKQNIMLPKGGSGYDR